MALELKNITHKVGSETHIYDTSLKLEPGGFNVLLGATNAGKSTLIKILAGLERPTEGQVLMNGQDVTGISPQKRNIALVHQFFVNYPHLSVYENIASPLRVAGIPKDEIRTRVHEAAEILKLEPMLERKPGELSGGQQQRCALARAIVKESTAIFLDEPLANLDYKLREELRDQLPDLFANRGSIVVYATSEPAEALMLGGQTILMHEGRITQSGATGDVYRKPQNLTAAEVFSDPPINRATVTKKGTSFSLGTSVTWEATGSSASLADGTYTVAIRPHFVVPTRTESCSVALDGVVEITEISGSDSVAHFRPGQDSSWVSLASGVHPYNVGEKHSFFFDPTACFYFDQNGSLAATGGAHG
ncbi:ABC transporter ATP-binding protein [Kiloniella sp. b19]|uniref:ABC transporter ATP-binding protein n=1 Tax=Kiloniella sp. GXU_MW_B19 TaxID=3141326 RepID=UPI0031DF7EDB